MAFEPEFLALMASTISIAPFSAGDGWGGVTHGTAVAGVPAHITYANKIVRGNTEEISNSTVQVEIPPPGYVTGGVTVPTVTVGSQVTLPDTTTRRVLSVTIPYDEDGVAHHQEVALT